MTFTSEAGIDMSARKKQLIDLNKNLGILLEREAKYGGNPPLELLNQIVDFCEAVALIEQALKGEEKTDQIKSHLSKEQIVRFQALVNEILIESHLVKYIADIIINTRSNPLLYLGASARASIAILKASKAFAAMNGRDFVTPEDIKKAAIPVLQHRVLVTPEREMEGVTTKQIINQIIDAVEIPR